MAKHTIKEVLQKGQRYHIFHAGLYWIIMDRNDTKLLVIIFAANYCNTILWLTHKPTSYPKEKISILFLENISDTAVKQFREAGYTDIRKLTGALSEEQLIKEVKNVHIARYSF